jgi:galactose mutarotase-like enzyme
MTDLITIANDHLTAQINPLGAELTSLKDAEGRELMTNADPAYWTGHAPILFPVVGRPYRDTIRVDDTEYPMKQHGFARRMVFAVSDQRPGSVAFTLEATPETRAVYPFDFALTITFVLTDATLAIDVAITNPAAQALPASFGFHPAFAWPLPYGQDRADHRIVFSADEPDTLRMIADDGTIAEGERPSPLEGRTLRLRDDLFAKDALVWDSVRSDSVTYGAEHGPQLRIDFPDTPKLGLWTKPGAAYVCVEPWHGIADPEGYTGEFRDKPGVFEVAPGDVKRIALRVTLVPPAR